MLLPSVITSRGRCVFGLAVGVRHQICLAGYVDQDFHLCAISAALGIVQASLTLLSFARDLPGRLARNFTCKHARNASDISLSKVKSCRSIAKRGPPGRSAKFFINLHLAGSIYRRRLKIFLEFFALAPFH